jgi:hypothetical protein
MKLTRRQLAALISTTTISATAISATAISQAQAQSTQAAAPADPLQAARDRLKANADLLAKQAVPMSIEPAFRFQP